MAIKGFKLCSGMELLGNLVPNGPDMGEDAGPGYLTVEKALAVHIQQTPTGEMRITFQALTMFDADVPPGPRRIKLHESQLMFPPYNLEKEIESMYVRQTSGLILASG